MKNPNNNEWIDNGQPSKFPEPNDSWMKTFPAANNEVLTGNPAIDYAGIW